MSESHKSIDFKKRLKTHNTLKDVFHRCLIQHNSRALHNREDGPSPDSAECCGSISPNSNETNKYTLAPKCIYVCAQIGNY